MSSLQVKSHSRELTTSAFRCALAPEVITCLAFAARYTCIRTPHCVRRLDDDVSRDKTYFD